MSGLWNSSSPRHNHYYSQSHNARTNYKREATNTINKKKETKGLPPLLVLLQAGTQRTANNKNKNSEHQEQQAYYDRFVLGFCDSHACSSVFFIKTRIDFCTPILRHHQMQDKLCFKKF
jgi:hypothetical protein